MPEQENLHPSVDHILTPTADDSPEARAERMMGNDVLREMLAGTAWEEELNLMIQNGDVESLDSLRRAAINLTHAEGFPANDPAAAIECIGTRIRKTRSDLESLAWLTDNLRTNVNKTLLVWPVQYPEDPYHDLVRQYAVRFKARGRLGPRMTYMLHHFSPEPGSPPTFMGNQMQEDILKGMREVRGRWALAPEDSQQIQVGRAVMEQLIGWDDDARPVSFKEVVFGLSEVEQLELQAALMIALEKSLGIALEPAKKVGKTAIKEVTQVKPPKSYKPRARVHLRVSPYSANRSTSPNKPAYVYDGSNHSLGRYYHEICKHTLLTAEEEVVLAKHIEAGLYAQHLLKDATVQGTVRRDLELVAKEGESAKERFIVSNLRLVTFGSYRYSSRIPVLDAIQEGNIGLIRAVEKFDFTQGYKFSTYAAWWIHRAVTRAIYKTERSIRLPERTEKALIDMESAKEALSKLLGRSPSSAEIAVEMGVSESKVIKLIEVESSQLYLAELDAPIGDEDDRVLVNTLASEDKTDEEASTNVDISNLRKILKEAMSILPTNEYRKGVALRQNRALILRFGLDGGDPMLLLDVGKELGVTKMGAKVMVDAAIERLRDVLPASLKDMFN